MSLQPEMLVQRSLSKSDSGPRHPRWNRLGIPPPPNLGSESGPLQSWLKVTMAWHSGAVLLCLGFRRHETVLSVTQNPGSRASVFFPASLRTAVSEVHSGILIAWHIHMVTQNADCPGMMTQTAESTASSTSTYTHECSKSGCQE